VDEGGIELPSRFQPLVKTYTCEGIELYLEAEDIYQVNLTESIRICNAELEELLNYAKLLGLKILGPVRFQG
jgi:hypothetical protein